MKHINFARLFITISSLFLFLSITAFFILATSLGFPLDYDQSISVVKQITPVFIGYIGQSAYYLISKSSELLDISGVRIKLLYILSISPFLIFSSLFCAIIFAFSASNFPDNPPGEGMSFSQLTDWFTIILGLFAATASIVTAWIFQGAKSND
ncbi:hypothetical protein WNZ14_21915 [Hoeflea sp. AS60]|uniref:hypothetical protein n=1 Tax=Hoeflea sp. AS60 TaxID=3135780 RepID=UPI00316EE457